MTPPRFLRRSWQHSLRNKILLLLAVASLLPLGLLAAYDLWTARHQLMDSTEAVLGARADELVRTVDGFNQTFQFAAERLAKTPALVAA
ncbi:MAG TPA: hypothetical protein VHU40_06365, partial [Polyangia bacterium]|nr:hypothetical protein [Polyangia bacterium]